MRRAVRGRERAARGGTEWRAGAGVERRVAWRGWFTGPREVTASVSPWLVISVCNKNRQQAESLLLRNSYIPDLFALNKEPRF